MGWKMNTIKVFTIKMHFQFLHDRVNMDDEVDGLLTTVYASHREERRKNVCSEFKNIIENIDCSWFVYGRFNDILSGSEKRGGTFPSVRKCDMFKDHVNCCNLMDLGSIGHKYMWKGSISHGGLRIYDTLE